VRLQIILRSRTKKASASAAKRVAAAGFEASPCFRKPYLLRHSGRNLCVPSNTARTISGPRIMKPRSSSEKEEAAIDDPCWGDPKHCSLEYLLSLISRSKSILHESDDYLVLNKPADLRMDGPYPATVHKLLTYWYPPPSLQSPSNSILLEKLQQLHRHSDIPDNALRPCHQLDYATSGVLLVAHTSQAAAWATTCFEKRKVQKAYSAVLHGHVTLHNCDKALPVVYPNNLDRIVQNQELQYRRTQNKRRSETFAGFQPPNTFLQIFQGRYQRRMENGSGRHNKKKRRREKLAEDQWNQVDKAMKLSEDEQAVAAQLSWKELKKHAKLKEGMERAAEKYNVFLREILKAEQQAQELNCLDRDDLPTFFRVQGDSDNNFYVYMSLAQVGEDFAMRIPLSCKRENPATWLHAGKDDDPSLNFKPALTKVTVQAHATLYGHPVTKVRLEPRTGRRHQLRVHTAFLGHAIVGDQTYESDADKTDKDLCPRMCLHANTLEFPLPNKQATKDQEGRPKGKEEKEEDAGEKMLHVVAPDPFMIQENGILKVVSII
jgi:23S rRNA-/tRNA-specific pseudouridylate synthase